MLNITMFPLDVLNYLNDFLDLSGLKTLRQVNKLFKKTVDGTYPKYVRLYQRLHRMAPFLPAELPRENFLKKYNDALRAVNELHAREFDELELPRELTVSAFQPFKRNYLEKLEAQDSVLEFTNGFIIKKCIDSNYNSTILNVSPSSGSITRFPSWLFRLPEYVDYFKKLTEIDISNNQVCIIPSEIEECQALESFNCDSNPISELPATLGNCSALEVLSLQDTNLKSIPKSLAKCSKITCINVSQNPELKYLEEELFANWPELEELYVSETPIGKLPATLGNCPELTKVDCKYGELNSLPESLADCQFLETVSCEGNHLTELPQRLVDKLGKEWEKEMLLIQIIPEEAPSVQAPQYTPAHNIKRQMDYDSEDENTPQSANDVKRKKL